MALDPVTTRRIQVPARCAGMRLDRFLAHRFPEWSRTALVEGIRAGQVRDPDRGPLRPSSKVRPDQVLLLGIPGIAPTTPPPPPPPVLWEDEAVVVVDKPPGLLVHPSGNTFVWSLLFLVRQRYPGERIDLVHRLDRDTSGCVLLTRDLEVNRALKEALQAGALRKEYEALCRGRIPWEHRHLRGSIGPDGGPIRIKMAVRDDGLPAHTEVRVIGRRGALTRVRCQLHTGRTHQIRVHLAHAGFPLLGDRLYGVPPRVFLQSLEEGPSAAIHRLTGAPRQALHARKIGFPHPSGRFVEVQAPLPADMARWWEAADAPGADGAEAGR